MFSRDSQLWAEAKPAGRKHTEKKADGNSYIYAQKRLSLWVHSAEEQLQKWEKATDQEWTATAHTEQLQNMKQRWLFFIQKI